MAFVHRRPLAGLAVGCLALAIGALHGTGALLASQSPSPYLLAAGISGFVVVFATFAALPTDDGKRLAVFLFGLSATIYVAWLGYALVTDVRPIPTDAVGSTLSGVLAASVAATLAAGSVLFARRLELVLGLHDPPEKRILSDEEYTQFRGSD